MLDAPAASSDLDMTLAANGQRGGPKNGKGKVWDEGCEKEIWYRMFPKNRGSWTVKSSMVSNLAVLGYPAQVRCYGLLWPLMSSNHGWLLAGRLKDISYDL